MDRPNATANCSKRIRDNAETTVFEIKGFSEDLPIAPLNPLYSVKASIALEVQGTKQLGKIIDLKAQKFQQTPQEKSNITPKL